MQPLWLMCRSSVFSLALAAVMAALAGCANILVPKYKVMVDALSDVEKAHSVGKSYRLVGSKTMLSQTTAQLPAIVACVNAALSGKGLYEAPPGSPSDIFIDVGFGNAMSPRGDPSVKEVFLHLSARENKAKSLDHSSEDEIWNVRVSVDGVTGKLEAAMPLLSSVAAEYMATDTQIEVQVDVPKKSPNVESVRLNAVKALEALNDRTTPQSSEPTDGK